MFLNEDETNSNSNVEERVNDNTCGDDNEKKENADTADGSVDTHSDEKKENAEM